MIALTIAPQLLSCLRLGAMGRLGSCAAGFAGLGQLPTASPLGILHPSRGISTRATALLSLAPLGALFDTEGVAAFSVYQCYQLVEAAGEAAPRLKMALCRSQDALSARR